MNKLLLLFTAALILFGAVKLTAGPGISEKQSALIDSALSKMNMNRGDLWLPADFSSETHRPAELEKIFHDPFYSGIILQDAVKGINSLDYNNATDFIRFLGKLIEFNNTDAIYFDKSFPAEEIKRELAANIDSKTDFVGAAVFRRYISLILQAFSVLKKDPLIAKGEVQNLITKNYEKLFPEFIGNNPDEAKIILAQTDKMRQSDIFRLGISLFLALREENRKNFENIEIIRNIKTVELETNYGRIALGGPGDDHYSGDYTFILDVGGNDTYSLIDTNKVFLYSKLRCLIDLGGNDTYSSPDNSIGGGILGINIIIDESGDDVYTGGDISLGAGFFGCGILYDGSGNDRYSGGRMTEGFGAYGIGLLIDALGDDCYSSSGMAQGCGYTRGAGIINDRVGNDRYFSSGIDFSRKKREYRSFSQGAGFGIEGIIGGGFGISVDMAGNDIYMAESFAQGGSHWYAYGGLYDMEGDDIYSGGIFSQGGAAMNSHAIFKDEYGNDNYSNKVRPAEAAVFSSGIFCDDNGDDNYSAEGDAAGYSEKSAVSFFCDISGNDDYKINLLQGDSEFKVYILADGGGNDSYSINEFKNNSVRKLKSLYFFDENRYESREFPKMPGNKGKTDIIDIIVSDNAAGYFENKEVEEIDHLAAYMSGREMKYNLALENLFAELLKGRHGSKVKSLLKDSLRSLNYNSFEISAGALSKAGIEDAKKDLASYLSADDWRYRMESAEALGRYDDENYVTDLAKILKDGHPYVRAAAAYSIAKITGGGSSEMLRIALQDNQSIVRKRVIRGLQEKQYIPASLILDLLVYFNPGRQTELISPLFAKISAEDTDIGTFIEQLMKMDETKRQYIYKKIKNYGSPSLKQALEEKSDNERK